MPEFPTSEDIQRDLALERAQKLSDEAQDILRGGGSHESLELVGELTGDVLSSTRKALTGKGGMEAITTQETMADRDRLLAQGINPDPNLSLFESRELQGYLNYGVTDRREESRKRFLEEKATGKRK